MVISPLACPVITGAPRLPSRKSKASPRAHPVLLRRDRHVEAPHGIEQPSLGAFERPPLLPVAGDVHVGEVAVQPAGAAARVGSRPPTSQLQSTASALTQRRQLSGRLGGRARPREGGELIARHEAERRPQRGQAICSNCSRSRSRRSRASRIASGRDRGPNSSQAMKPTAAGEDARTQITFLPVLSFDPIAAISAQMSSASRMTRRSSSNACFSLASRARILRPAGAARLPRRRVVVEERRQLLGHRARELLHVGDRHRAARSSGSRHGRCRWR